MEFAGNTDKRLVLGIELPQSNTADHFLSKHVELCAGVINSLLNTFLSICVRDYFFFTTN